MKISRHLIYFFIPEYRKKQEQRIVEQCFHRLEELSRSLKQEDGNSGITNELEQTFFQAKVLYKRFSKKKHLKCTCEKIAQYFKAFELAKEQRIPFRTLIENHYVYRLIIANHLHHKITPEHRAQNLRITFHDGKLYIPIKKENRLVPIDELPKLFPNEYNPKTGRVEQSQFLAEGFEVHNRRKWKALRPVYKMQNENSTYVHFDNLLNEKSTIGPINRDYFQFVNLYPWGKTLCNGAFFGHTWMRIVHKGELYHIGFGLDGSIIDPDFMSTTPFKGKKFKFTDWIPLSNDQIPQLFSQFYLIQELIQKGEIQKKSHSAEIAKIFYEDVYLHKGGTCTTAALMIHKRLTGVDLMKQNGSIAIKIIFNKVVRKIITLFLSIFPRYMRLHTLRPIRILSTGEFPSNI